MTLQGPLPYGQLSYQLGVNEIASVITVGKYVGSLWTRKRDAVIFDALVEKYEIFMRRIPDYLAAVTFSRSGTALGAGQRRIAVPDTLPDIQLNSIDGIATFVILVLRYVESPEDIVDHLQRLLKGEYAIICGGMLESSESEPPMASLPFSIRENLRSYVRSVLDADADSPQHRRCLIWLSELSSLIGNARDLLRTSKYSRSEHRRFVKYLLGGRPSANGLPANQFHTLALGTAMIALAALANGANISLVCVTNDGQRISLPQDYRPHTQEEPLSVILWLTDPPKEVAQTLNVAQTFDNPSRGDLKPHALPVHGGSAEISRIMARRLSCDSLPPEDCLLLWEEGMTLGLGMTWTVISNDGNFNNNLRLRLSKSSMYTDHSVLLEPLAKKWYSGPRSDIRHDLARKAAGAFHNVYRYNDYENIDAKRAETSINLVLTAFAVGCLKKLFSNAPPRLSCYAIVFEDDENPVRLLSFCDGLITTGYTLTELMHIAGSVWGGLVPHHSFPDARLVGIVCPEITILLDVLHDPKSLAKNGLAKGIMSLFEGSVPIIPQDPFHGAVIAGDPNQDQVYSTVDDRKNSLPHSTSGRTQPPEFNLIFTVEPFVQPGGSLSAILCAWGAGDVAFQLNPYNVFHNLIYKRKLESADEGLRQRELSAIRSQLREPEILTTAYINRATLMNLQYLQVKGCGAIIDSGPIVDWQIAAAGCVLPGFAIMVVEESDHELLQTGRFDLKRLTAGTCLISCCGDYHPSSD
jgi:hypothetical protein